MKKLLLTGATGTVAKFLRPYLSTIADTVVLSSREPIGDLAPHEESRMAELSRFDEVNAAVQGCDGILHLGGYSVEGPFDDILEANIRGVYNLYEAANRQGKPRILFASSNHVIGFYPQTQRLNSTAPHRPDSLYGVSKSFGESLARFYFDNLGQETAIVRIGSCLEQPTNIRNLSTWLSIDDFVDLIQRVFSIPVLGCPVIYGASNNDRSWWDNDEVSYLGWSPKDNAERFASDIPCDDPNPEAPINLYQGGNFIVKPNNQES